MSIHKRFNIWCLTESGFKISHNKHRKRMKIVLVAAVTENVEKLKTCAKLVFLGYFRLNLI